eukprot:GHVT01064709.1.p1 GENE.GHVT01064709.1~~GHVT01064709.1.p1  ORF type:complete len:110 (-),score=2.15 GHVT01064709.1:1489-1818(-)
MKILFEIWPSGCESSLLFVAVVWTSRVSAPLPRHLVPVDDVSESVKEHISKLIVWYEFHFLAADSALSLAAFTSRYGAYQKTADRFAALAVSPGMNWIFDNSVTLSIIQ